MPFNVAPCACCWAGTCGASSKQDLGLVLMPEKTLVFSNIHNNHRLMMVHEINEYRWLRTQLCYWWRSSGGEGGAKPNQTRLRALDHSHGRPLAGATWERDEHYCKGAEAMFVFFRRILLAAGWCSTDLIDADG